jgi:hypothetical protein
VQG